MKLFKSLLVAPATLGLLAPMSATANEVTIDDFTTAEELAITNSRVDGLEARMNNFEAGSFSETTSASFSVDFGNGFTAATGMQTSNTGVLTEESLDSYGINAAYTGENYGVSPVSYTHLTLPTILPV